MQVRLYDSESILIIPETDFEEEFLVRRLSGQLKARLKSGASPADIIGIKVERDKLEVQCDTEQVEV